MGPNKISDAPSARSSLGKTPDHQFVLKQRIGGEFSDAIPLPPGRPGSLVDRPETKLGLRTQVTSSPLMVVDNTGTQEEKAIFRLYDPDAGCNGSSYVTILPFFSAPKCTAPQISGYRDAMGRSRRGQRHHAHFRQAALRGAKRGIGRDASATLTPVPVDGNTLSGIPTFLPVRWRASSKRRAREPGRPR